MKSGPGVAIMLGVGKEPKRQGGPPPMGGMSGRSAPPRRDAMPSPAEETSEGETGIPPEAVCYRDEAQKCEACEYFGGGQCTKLKMPVDAGASCNLFEAGRGGTDMDYEQPAEQPEEAMA